MKDDVGYQLQLGSLSPAFVTVSIREDTFNRHINMEVLEKLMSSIREHRESRLVLGYGGPFYGAQMT